jgi:hypothetical protein
MFCQIVLGTSAHLHPDTLAVEPNTYMLGEVGLRPVFEAFWLAHEYAHVAKGHYEAIFRDPTASRPEFEKEADIIALRAMLHAFDNPVVALIAVGAFLSIFQLFERGYELIGEVVPPPHGGITHPAASDRLRSLLFVASGELPAAQYMEAAHWLDIYGQTLRKYWAPLESALPVARESFAAGWVPRDPREERDALKRWVTLVAKHISA